jgi:hypothetical protein
VQLAPPHPPVVDGRRVGERAVDHRDRPVPDPVVDHLVAGQEVELVREGLAVDDDSEHPGLLWHVGPLRRDVLRRVEGGNVAAREVPLEADGGLLGAGGKSEGESPAGHPRPGSSPVPHRGRIVSPGRGLKIRAPRP